MKNNINIKSDKPLVVLPLEDYESLKETIEILSDNPKISKELKKGKQDYLKGNYFHYDINTKKLTKNTFKSKRKTV
ncbi:MAG: hypothetical protein EHM58_12035 [Ignavibacteriae bacterium]|nr:MAG: hypothetical protein EHM58_12035 [Ignavibacteriota bacterium]